MDKLKKQQGIALYISIIFLAILLAIGIGISSILLGHLRVIYSMSDSVVAIFAADSGIERALFEAQNVSGYLDSPDNKIRYQARFLEPGPGCPAFSYCIESIGVFKGTKRSIKVVR